MTQSHTLNNSNIRIERYPSAEETSKKAGEYINDLLTQYVDTPILLLVAGGSSLAVLEHVNPDYLSPDITVTTTDDRFSTELDINNFAVLQTTSFYNSLVQADAFCISTEPFENETLKEYAHRFEKNLKEWKQDFPKGKIIALYGMGADGHTGGMIPGLMNKEEFYREFNNPNSLVGVFDATTYDNGSNAKSFEFPVRISTSMTFMKDWVDHAIFYITGESKRNALTKVSEDSSNGIGSEDLIDLSMSPVSIVNFMKDSVIFTDIL